MWQTEGSSNHSGFFFCVVLLFLMDFPCQIVFHWLHPRWACEVNPIHLGNFSRKIVHSGELKMNNKPFDKTGSPLVAWQWRHLRGAAVPLSSSTSAEARGSVAVCDWQPVNNTARIQLDTDGARAFPAVTAHAQLIKTHFSVTKQLTFLLATVNQVTYTGVTVTCREAHCHQKRLLKVLFYHKLCGENVTYFHRVGGGNQADRRLHDQSERRAADNTFCNTQASYPRNQLPTSYPEKQGQCEQAHTE